MLNSIAKYKKDILHFYILFILTIFVIYFLGTAISKLYLAFLLIFFAISSKNYFWLAFTLLLNDAPGGFFSASDPQHSLELFSILGRNIHFSEIFVIVSVLKGFLKKIKPPKYFFKLPLILLLYYFIFLILTSSMVGIDFTKYLLVLRSFMVFLLLPFMTMFFRNEEDILGFFAIIFTIPFIIFFSQLFIYITGMDVAVLLGGSYVAGRENLTEEFGFVRALYGSFVLFLAYFGAILYSNQRINKFNRKYLILIIVISLTSIILMATRGWILAFFLMLLFWIITSERRIYKYLSYFLIVGLIFFLLSNILPRVEKQFVQALDRLETMSAIAKGDYTAKGTLARITQRSPRVMNKFEESPIFGFGFTNDFFEYNDGHVGNQNILLNGGVVGFSFFLFFIFSILLKLLRNYNYLSNRNIYKKSMLIFIGMFLSIILIHSTSMQWFTYILGTGNRGLFLLIFLYLLNHYYYKSRAYKVLNQIIIKNNTMKVHRHDKI